MGQYAKSDSEMDSKVILKTEKMLSNFSKHHGDGKISTSGYRQALQCNIAYMDTQHTSFV